MDRESRFESLYEHQQPDVLAYFLRRLSREDAVEATADVFLTAWRRIDDTPDEADARRWLFGVAHNVLRNRYRADRRMRRLVSKMAIARVPPHPLPETMVIRREQDREMLMALNRLRPEDREVLQLRLWEEATYDEMAALLGCSRHAAEQRYSKALRRLRSACRRAGHAWMGRSRAALPAQEPSHEN